MKKYLAIFEAPCVGSTAEVIYADDPTGADFIAWERSCNDEYIVNGGYDLYQIVYNHDTHKHELLEITPEMLEEVEEQ